MELQLPEGHSSNPPVRTPVKIAARKVKQLCTPPSTSRKGAKRVSEGREIRTDGYSPNIANSKRQRLGSIIENLPASVIVDEKIQTGPPLEGYENSGGFKPSKSSLNKLATFRLNPEPLASCVPGTSDGMTQAGLPARSQSVNEQVLVDFEDNSMFDLGDTNTNSTAGGTEQFDLDEEEEAELAELTDWTLDEPGADMQGNTTERLQSPKTSQLSSSAQQPLPSTFSVSDNPPQSQSLQNLNGNHSDKPSPQIPKPFTHPPFPKPLQDHSPITGIKSSNVLRTCFRIGEALNAASLASRSGTTILTELYARVRSSFREPNGGKQHFEFADLFCGERPPLLSGTYELWRDGGLWEEDSKVFVGDEGNGKMCRAVGWLKRDLETRLWKMVVLSVWEADWEDVDWVKGIVGA